MYAYVNIVLTNESLFNVIHLPQFLNTFSPFMAQQEVPASSCISLFYPWNDPILQKPWLLFFKILYFLNYYIQYYMSPFFSH